MCFNCVIATAAAAFEVALNVIRERDLRTVEQ